MEMQQWVPAVNVNVFSVDMEIQEWVPAVTELLNILTGVNGVKVFRSSCVVPDPFPHFDETWSCSKNFRKAPPPQYEILLKSAQWKPQ
jgi:hypothetical protein